MQRHENTPETTKTDSEKPLNPLLFQNAMQKSIPRQVLTFLTRKELISTTRTNRFFREESAVPKLINLVTQYKMDEKEAKLIEQRRSENHIAKIKTIHIVSGTNDEKQAGQVHEENTQLANNEKNSPTTKIKEMTNEIEIHYQFNYHDKITNETIEISNPILIAIDIELQKNPWIAFQAAHFMDPSKRLFHCSALEYAIRTRNFPVIHLIRKHAAKINQEKQVDTMEAEIRALAEMPIQPKRLVVSEEQNISDRILIWTVNHPLFKINVLPKNTILMQLINKYVVTYAMGEEARYNETTHTRVANRKIKMDTSVPLARRLEKYDHSQRKEMRKWIKGKEMQHQEFITMGEDPHLVNELRRIAGFPKLPYGEKEPTLIKQGNQISFWGKLNGKWRLHELPQQKQALFKNLFHPLEGSESKLSDEEQNEIQQILKQYHNEYIDLEAYLRNAQEFIDKYPSLGKNDKDQCDADWTELIWGAQKLFPAWIAQLWCSEIIFEPIPNFIYFIMGEEGTKRQIHSGADFYESCGSLFGAILKYIYRLSRSSLEGVDGSLFIETDVKAMTVLNDLIHREQTRELPPQTTHSPKP